MQKINKYLFWILLTIGIFFRLYLLGSLPASLNWDEISHGYNAYSIMKTGRDQWGTSLPIFNFRSYGDYPTTLNMYLTIPFIKLFGLTPLAIRLPNFIFSVIYLIYTYLFASLVFNKKSLSLITFSLAVFVPWSFFSSRGVFQSTFSETLLLMGLYYFYRSLKIKTYFNWSLLCFGLSLYAYHNTRIIIPVLLIFLVYTHFNQIKNNLNLFSYLIFVVLFIPNLINLFSFSSFARNRWVGIINQNSINIIESNRNDFSGPPIIAKLIYNRPIYFTQTFILNYINYLNPIPLFFSGTQNHQLSVPNLGLLFIILLPFLYLGIYQSFTNYRYRPLIYLFVITLLPSALTVGDFPSLRLSSALIFYLLFITLGISFLRLKTPFIFIFTIFVFFLIYWNKYLIYQIDYSSTWQYGYSQIVDYSRENYSQYDQIIVTKKYGEPHEFFLFYWPWDPSRFQTDPNLSWNFHADWYWIDGFDKFKFINDWEIKDLHPKAKTLLITSPQNYPTSNSRLIKTINFKNQAPAFDIISYD